MIKILKSNFNIEKYQELNNKLISDVMNDIKPDEISNLSLILKNTTSKCIYCVIKDIILYDESIDFLIKDYKMKTYLEITSYYNLSSEPKRLADRNKFLEEFYNYIISNDEAKSFIPSYELLSDLNNLKPKIKNSILYKSYINEILFKEYLDFNATCNKVFDYEKYIKPIRAPIIESFNIEICPYCNENSIHIVNGDTEDVIAVADLDHFYLQSRTPLLALTFNNFVPCCIQCNRALKLQSVAKILNPRHHGFDNKAIFKVENPIQLAIKDEREIEIDLIIDKSSAKFKEIQESKKLFKIKEIYNHNSTKKELQKLSKLTKSLAKGGIKNYQKLFDDEELTFEMAYETLLGFSVDTTDFINIKHGKLLSDIFGKEYFR